MMPEIDRDSVATDIISGASFYETEAVYTKEQHQKFAYKNNNNNNNTIYNNNNLNNKRLLHANMAASITPEQHDLTAPYVYRSPLVVPPGNYRYDHMYNSNMMAALNTQQQYMAAAAAAAAMGSMPPNMDLGSKMYKANYVGNTAAHHLDTHSTITGTNLLQKTLESPRLNEQNGVVGTVAHPNTTSSAPPPQTALLSPPLLPPPQRSKTPHPRRISKSPPSNAKSKIKNATSINLAGDAVKKSHKLMSDMTSPPTWHPHVYGHRPNRPTPYGIADILGWPNTTPHANNNAHGDVRTMSNSAVAVLIDESSNSSSSAVNQPPTPAKSPKTILRNFQQQLNPPTFDMRSTSASDASEEDMSIISGNGGSAGAVSADVSDQPLNLCVAKKPRENSNSPMLPAMLNKHNSITAAVNQVEANTGTELAKVLGKSHKKGNQTFANIHN